MHVFRPADIVETAEAWQLALETADKPSVLALSRQSLPQLRLTGDALDGAKMENKTTFGGYILREASTAPQVTLLPVALR